MPMTIRYTRGQEVAEVQTSLPVIVAWERKFRAKASQLGQNVGMEDLCYLAFEASKRAGIVVPAEFDRFVESVTDLEVVNDEDENPTPPAL